ncbi:hypothetical protein JHK82_042868 [Glycine max]|nr:hypothetical protein JHK85_043513 [Glycine max]KAG5105898.1 hypothetical protein JHK82_042868 [Glycine max]
MDLFQNPSSLKSNRFETSMWIAKLVLMSMGVISTLVLLKVTIVPYTFHRLLSTLPQFCVSVTSWLRLSFLYIIFNFIIITIAASFDFHPKTFSDSPPTSDPKHTTTIILDTANHPTESENQTNAPKEEEKELEQQQLIEESGLTYDKFMIHPSLESCTNDYFLLDSDGDDTLEAMWRAILEGQGKTMKPQLKNSDAWGAIQRTALKRECQFFCYVSLRYKIIHDPSLNILCF